MEWLLDLYCGEVYVWEVGNDVIVFVMVVSLGLFFILCELICNKLFCLKNVGYVGR